MGLIIYLGVIEDVVLLVLVILFLWLMIGVMLFFCLIIGFWKMVYRKRLCVILYLRESSCFCLCYIILLKVKLELIIIDIFMNCCIYY